MSQAARSLAVCALGALVLACNDQPTDLGPAGLVIVQAPSTAGAPGWELIDTLVVRAVDPSGTPRGGVTVSWTVREGGGGIAPTAATADANGYAKAVWTLGSVAGVNRVWASTPEGGQAEFQSTGEAFRVDRLASSGGMGCGLVSGALWCWNFIANSAPPSKHPVPGRRSASPTLVDDSHDFVDVGVRNYEVCALDPQQRVWCATSNQPTMTVQNGLPPMRSLASNGDSWGDPADIGLCGLAASDSTAWCWHVGGASAQVPGSPNFTGLWLGDMRACGLLADSSAACWGPAPLGDGSSDPSDTPVAVNGGLRFVDLVVGRDFACGRAQALELWCWGAVSTGPDLLTPALVETGSMGIATWTGDVGSLSTGGGMTLWAWDGTLKKYPRVVYGLDGLTIEGFSQNNALSCLRLVDGQVYCYDQLWDFSSDVPVNQFTPLQPTRNIPLTVQVLK